MTSRFPKGPTIAGAIGSAAVAAAMLYASKRKQKPDDSPHPARIPGGENPETD